MPQYLWKDEKSGTEKEVLRSFQEYEVPPTEEEAPELVGTDPKWVRVMSGGQKVIRANGWGKKGYWTFLISTGAAGLCIQFANYLN